MVANLADITHHKLTVQRDSSVLYDQTEAVFFLVGSFTKLSFNEPPQLQRTLHVL